MTRWMVAIVLGGALLFAFWPPEDREGESAATSSRQGSTKRGSQRSRLSPAETFRELQGLSRRKVAQGAPSFKEICHMVRRLTRQDLEALVTENDTFGWHLSSRIRSAAFAELARRDPEEALRLAKAYGEEDDDPFRTRLKLDRFSVIRGWAEVDAVGALETLNRFKTESVAGTDLYRVVHDPWKNAAFRHVFTHLARQDLEAAMASLPPKEDSYMRKHAWIGLFAGARDIETLDKLAAFRREVGDNPQILISGFSFQDVPEVIISYLPEGATEEVIINPSVHDVWLASSPSNEPTPVLTPDSMHQLQIIELQGLKAQIEREPFLGLINRPHDAIHQDNFKEALRLFGARHPEESLRALRGEYPEMMRVPLALGVASAHPQHAQEIVSLIAGDDERVSILTKAIYERAREREEQLYPIAGEGNTLPDHHVHYQQLLEATEAAELPPEGHKVVLESLRNEFFGRVPAAELLPNKN